MASHQLQALGGCADTTYRPEENIAFRFGSPPVADDRNQVQKELIALFNRQIKVEETPSYGDQTIQLPPCNQSIYDATQCLGHSPYAALEECMQQSANPSRVTMRAIAEDCPINCGIDPWSLSAEQLRVFQYALHEKRLGFPGDPSAYRGDSNIVDSPAVERQPSVDFKVHRNGQILSFETADGLEDPSQLRPAVDSEADNSPPEYLGDDDDLQYAESYMIAGYETLSGTL